jgi:hypothetical protein
MEEMIIDLGDIPPRTAIDGSLNPETGQLVISSYNCLDYKFKTSNYLEIAKHQIQQRRKKNISVLFAGLFAISIGIFFSFYGADALVRFMAGIDIGMGLAVLIVLFITTFKT